VTYRFRKAIHIVDFDYLFDFFAHGVFRVTRTKSSHYLRIPKPRKKSSFQHRVEAQEKYFELCLWQIGTSDVKAKGARARRPSKIFHDFRFAKPWFAIAPPDLIRLRAESTNLPALHFAELARPPGVLPQAKKTPESKKTDRLKNH